MKVTHLAVSTALGIVAVCAALVAGSANAAQTSLPATQLCEPMSSAQDVNDAGTVAGYVGSWPDVRAVTCSGENDISYLYVPADATGSIAVAINNRGQVAGQINLVSGGQEAVIWNSNSGVLTRLGVPTGAFFSSAQDINDSGSIVGVVGMSGGTRAFLWDGSGSHALPLPDGYTNSIAQGINNDGAIAGTATAMYEPNLALVWHDGVIDVLPPLQDGATASAVDINDVGQVVGNSSTTAPPWLFRHPVFWDGGVVVDLDALGGSFGLASAINAEGQIAGYTTNAVNEYHGFVWKDGTMTLLDPLPGDAQSFASGINGAGKIVGISSLTLTGVGRAVSWTAGDTARPELTVSASPSVLWPPNHQYVTVQATVTATDEVDPNPLITLVSVTSNEPDNGLDDGNTIDDIVIYPADSHPYSDTFELRAERSGIGSGRIYTITYTATDASGNSATESVTVIVPLEW